MTNIEFQLNPTLPYINTEATKGFFYVQYPSGLSYWQIQTVDGLKLQEGNYTFSQEILAQWLDSDQILIDTILADAPWIVKPLVVEPSVEPSTTSTSSSTSTTTTTTVVAE